MAVGLMGVYVVIRKFITWSVIFGRWGRIRGVSILILSHLI